MQKNPETGGLEGVFSRTPAEIITRFLLTTDVKPKEKRAYLYAILNADGLYILRDLYKVILKLEVDDKEWEKNGDPISYANAYVDAYRFVESSENQKASVSDTGISENTYMIELIKANSTTQNLYLMLLANQKHIPDLKMNLEYIFGIALLQEKLPRLNLHQPVKLQHPTSIFSQEDVADMDDKLNRSIVDISENLKQNVNNDQVESGPSPKFF